MSSEKARPTVEAVRYCGYCGRPVEVDGPPIERFGERFCSEAHAEEFVAGVRSARIELVARPKAAEGPGCASPAADSRTWKGSLARAACWLAPLLLVLAIPLLWTGGALPVAGGSLLSLLAVLGCPLGMYFMMRAMGNTSHDAEDRRR
jgi:hypothetical protein